MKTKTNCVLVAEDKEFTDKESGKVINYVDCSLIVDGETIGIKIKDASKGVFRVLRRFMSVEVD